MYYPESRKTRINKKMFVNTPLNAMLISHFIHPNTFYFGFKEFIFLHHFLFLKLFNGIKIVYLLTIICFKNIFSPFYCFNYGVTDAETKMSKVTPLSDRRGHSENWVIDWLRKRVSFESWRISLHVCEGRLKISSVFIQVLKKNVKKCKK